MRDQDNVGAGHGYATGDIGRAFDGLGGGLGLPRGGFSSKINVLSSGIAHAGNPFQFR